MYGDYQWSGYKDRAIIKEISIQNLIGIMNSPAWGRLGMETQEQMLDVLAAYAKGSVENALKDTELNVQAMNNQETINQMFK